MGNNVKMKTDGGNIVLTGIDGDKDNDKAEDKTDSDKTDVSAEQEKPPKDMGLSERFEHHMSKQGDKLSDMNPEQIKAKMLPLLISMTSKALFLLMPFFALMLKLLFVRRDPLYIDHLIFAFHYHSFLFLVLTLLIW